MDYNDEMQRKNILKLREKLENMPPYCGDFFRGIENVTSHRTRLAYAYDLNLFFNYLRQAGFSERQINDVNILNKLTLTDLEKYIEYLNYFEETDKDGNVSIHKNTERGKSRKIASLRTFYKYFYKKQVITSNPASLIDMPKYHQKQIIRLEPDEVSRLLDIVEKGPTLTKSQQKYYEKTKVRDFALISLLLGTGMRVSECVGIDRKNIDFENNGIKILRKGGSEQIIYFGKEVRDALIDYLDERRSVITDTDALFLSMQNKRITVRAVENLVKKYTKQVTTLKNISPHKLRSTYGTNLYKETGDIYLVADVLGHRDVNTTRKHYAQIDDDRRRIAAKVVKLRDL
ncbi:MAG: tyrosine-type recombinase/integrase [Clostridia bacterium]|nr:tyrosine-type recombinase/integrase [Clostridia bacterium]